jgi:prevent-host-death family protein
METVGMFEAKTHFSALVARVKLGEEIEISERGKPVAKIVPIKRLQRASTAEILAEFDAMRASFKGPPSCWEELKSLRDEGRKY